MLELQRSEMFIETVFKTRPSRAPSGAKRSGLSGMHVAPRWGLECFHGTAYYKYAVPPELGVIDSFPHSLARELRARGADVVTALDVLMAGRSDDDRLSWVAANARAFFSFIRGDCCRLHTIWLREVRSRSGVIFSRQDLSLVEQMRRLLRLAHPLTAEDMRIQIQFLSAWG